MPPSRPIGSPDSKTIAPLRSLPEEKKNHQRHADRLLADFFLGDDAENPIRAEAMGRLTDAARQLDDQMLTTAAAIVEILAGDPKA